MRILICGSREWTDRQMIKNGLSQVPWDTVVIHGAEPNGADHIADECAKALGLSVKPYPAEWRKYGKPAGPRLNQQMLNEGKPDVVWAFKKRGAKNIGTSDMVDRAERAGIPTFVEWGD